jgi:GWxTD domain-containing protein
MSLVPSLRKAHLCAGLLLVSTLVGGLAGAGELPEKYRKWLDEEVVYIISPREREAFGNLESAQEWDAFIEAFWRRRDPDLLTPVNEFREEHYRRLAFANRELGRESAMPGWMTDRGKMYIILGEPADRETFMAVPGLYPVELWSYRASQEKALPPLYLLFFQEGFAGPYRLFNHLLDEPSDLMPAQPFDPANVRTQAYEFLQEINPALAHAVITMRADEAPFAGLTDASRSALDFEVLLSDIYDSPFHRLDTRWVDAANDARGLVESDYLFNYVPSVGMLNVIPGPGGESFAHYSIEIEPQYMTLARQEGKPIYYTSFEVRGELSTREGKTVYQFSKELPLELTESRFREVMSRPFAFRDMFPIAEGEYDFRLVLKNRARSEYTLFETPVLVEPGRKDGPSLGEPVLLYGLSELEAPEAARLYRTYQLGNLVLDPDARRVYAAGDPLLAFLPVVGASEGERIAVMVEDRERPGEPVGTQTIAVGKDGAPLVATVPLNEATGGRYRLVADLIAASGEVLASRSTPFDVSPRAQVARPWILRDSIDGENEAVVRAALAEQYLVLGDRARARTLCERSLQLSPDLLSPRLLLGRLALDDGNPREAVRLLEPAHAQHPDDADVLLALGDAHLQVRHFSRAVDLLEAAIPLRRPTPPLLNALGIAHSALGHRDKALEYLRRSLEIDPEQPSVVSLVDKLRASSQP